MRTLLVAANTLGAALSLIWLWGHSTTDRGNWEIWFALGYLSVAVLNLVFFFRGGRELRRSLEDDEP